MKRSIYILLTFAVGIILLNGCSKEDMNESMFEDSYRFFVSGKFNEDQVRLYAGEGNLILSTQYTENGNLVKMEGEIENPENPSKNSFKLIFTGARASSSAAFSTSSVMQLGDFALADLSGYTRTPNQYLVRCDVSNPVTGLQYTWKRNGQSLGNYLYYTQQMSEEELTDARFTLETTNNTGSCSGIIYHEITSPQDSSWANIKTSLSTELSLFIESNYSSNIQSVSWYKDGSKLTDGLSILADINTSASYEAHVLFEDGSTHVTGITTDLANIASLCASDFTMEINPATIYNSENVNTVEVVYHDANGKRYSSYYENNTGSFTLENVSQYDNNENNNPTIRFGFWGDMILKADDGAEMDCSFTGNMAVAHPAQ